MNRPISQVAMAPTAPQAAAKMLEAVLAVAGGGDDEKMPTKRK